MNDTFGILLCDDLLFSSRILATARQLGLTVRTARSRAELETLAANASPECVILDLALTDSSIDEVVSMLRRRGTARIVAYGSHVDAASLHAARGAGCDVVLPRSKFVEQLPVELSQWLAAERKP